MSTRVELQTHFSPTAGGLVRPVNLESIGTNVLRYSLVLILVLFGVLKFTAAEAAAIKPPSGHFVWRYHNVPSALRGFCPTIATTG